MTHTAKMLTALLLAAALCVMLPGCMPGVPDPEPEAVEPVATPAPAPEPVKLNYNYLTGLYDLPDDRVGMRPYAISVNNNYDGWPQSGTSKADVVLEIETEGGITRLMCIFSDVSDAGNIGSIRSLRHQFVQGMYQWNPIIVHIGTSNYCNEILWSYGIKTLNGYYTEKFLFVDTERLKTYASEHCKFTNKQLILEGLEEQGIEQKLDGEMAPAFNFTTGETRVIPSGGDAYNFTFDFSEGYYDGTFKYNPVTRRYYKFQDGQAHIDAGDGTTSTQLSFDNVIVLFAYIGGIKDTILTDVYYDGGGEGYYFSQGRYDKLHWEKPAWNENFIFTKEDGSELVVNTGKTYLAVIRDYYGDDLKIDYADEVEEAEE